MHRRPLSFAPKFRKSLTTKDTKEHKVRVKHALMRSPTVMADSEVPPAQRLTRTPRSARYHND
jgi:hypothetical protein